MKSDLNQGLTEVNNGLADVHRAGEDIFSKTIATFTGGGGGDSTTAAPAVIPLINADDFQIPESLSESLKNIHIPTLTQLKSSIGNMISIPFKVAQAEVDDRFSSLIQSTNSTTSHILGLSHSSSSSFSIAPPTGFCAEKIDTRWIDTVADACIKALHIGLIIIAVLAIVFTLANAVKIWLEHRKMERRVARLTAKLGLHMQHDSQQQQHPRMHPEILSREVLRYAQDPTFHVVSKSIGKRLGGSNNKNSQYKWRWFLDYIHHEPSLSILGFGILGVLVILLQIWLLYFTTQQLIPTLADKIAASANHIVSTVSESMTKAMVVMFDPVNQHIAAVEQRANEAVDAFVDDVAYPLNRTLRTIMSGFKHTIAEAFHAVPVLETAILGFGGCVLGIDGSGIDSFDDSIQEIKSKLRFTFVRLDADTAGIPESQMEKSVLGILHSHESDQERLASTASSSSLLSSSSTTIDPSSNTATTSNSSTFSSSATIKSWIESQVQKFVKRVEKTLRMSLWPFYDMIAFGVVVPCLGVLRIFIWVISDCVQKCKNKGNNSNNSSTGMRGGGCCGKRRSKKHT